MENANSKDYLEKIKTQVIENLKKTAHAPSVQLTEVPRTTLAGTTDEDEDILDDEDEDMNKDVRTTKRSWDQRVTRDDELDESEDEEQARANGITAKEGPKRRNVSAGPDVEMQSASPAPEASSSKVSEPASAAQVTEEATVVLPAKVSAPVADSTGDVAMTDAVHQEKEATAGETISKQPDSSNKVA